MSFVRNLVRYLMEDLTPTQWRRVTYLFALMFVITMGAAIFYGLFDQQMLIATWFGFVGTACVILSGGMYVFSASIVAVYTVLAIGLGSIFGSAAGVFIANLY